MAVFDKIFSKSRKKKEKEGEYFVLDSQEEILKGLSSSPEETPEKEIEQKPVSLEEELRAYYGFQGQYRSYPISTDRQKLYYNGQKEPSNIFDLLYKRFPEGVNSEAFEKYFCKSSGFFHQIRHQTLPLVHQIREKSSNAQTLLKIMQFQMMFNYMMMKLKLTTNKKVVAVKKIKLNQSKLSVISNFMNPFQVQG